MYNNEKGKQSPKRDLVNNVSNRKNASTTPSNKEEVVKKDAWNDSPSSYQPKWTMKSNTTKPVNKKVNKQTEICSKEEHNTTTSSSTSSSGQDNMPRENVPTKDDACDELTTKNIRRMIPSSECFGFSESSSLSVIRDCTDNPSIMCHCKNSSHSAPILENDYSYFKLREYETSPNFTNTFGFEANERPMGMRDMCSHEANLPHSNVFQVESDCEPSSCNFHQHKKDTSVIIKCHCNSHDRSRYINVQHEIMQPRIDNSRIDEKAPSNTAMCACHPNPYRIIESSQNAMPELYAAKVKVGCQDIPKQFIFDAVKSPKNETNYKNDVSGRIYSGKGQRRFSMFSLSSKRLHKSPKFTKIEQNWNSGDQEQELKKDEQVTTQGDDLNDWSEHAERPERIEVYYFDHGCSGYFRTTDNLPPLHTDIVVEKVNVSATRFWAEIFGVLHVATTFFIAFILQLLRFVFYSILRPLIVGIIQITSDYLFKPILAILFNAILQPILIFIYNITSSLKDICELIAQAIGYFLREIANVCRAIRLVDVKNSTKNGPFSGSVPYNQKTEV